MINVPVKREFLGFGKVVVPKNTALKMRKIIMKSAINEYVRKHAERIVEDIEDRDEIGEAKAIFNFIQMNTRYGHDPRGTEYIQTPHYILKQIEVGMRPTMDCFPLTQKIVVRHRFKRNYILKELGDLQDSFHNYEALSYDFNTNSFKFKSITRYLDKGKKDVYEVKLKNGQSFQCTKDHELYFYVKNGRKNEFKLQIIKLQDIDLNSYEQNRVLIAKQIPSMNAEPGKYKKELWLEGLYVAEGCNSRGVILAINNMKLMEKTEKLLEELGLTTKKYIREKTGNMLYLHKHPYRDYLKNNFGGKANTKQFPDNYLSFSINQLEELIKGYSTGDGYMPKRGAWLGKLRVMYTTVSDKLAEQLIFIHLLFGRPLYTYYQSIEYLRSLKNIKKLYSKQSNWRLFDRITTGRFKYSAGAEILPGLTATKIKSITKINKQEVCDITVKDTHNFVSPNGIILKQCDDYTTTTLALLRSLGFKTKIRVTGYLSDGRFSHVYGLVVINNKWHPYDCVRKDQVMGWEAPGKKRQMDILV